MKKQTKQQHIWQIDDDVYYIEETDCPGQLPGLSRGTVEEINRDALHVRIGPGNYDLVWVDRDLCFSEADDLYHALLAHMKTQYAKLQEEVQKDEVASEEG